MTHRSPLHALHEQAEALVAAYGPPVHEGEEPVGVVQTFGELEVEYAAIRKSCIILDTPHRATLEVRGSERLAFLNRMLTQELKDLGSWHARPSFWLNRKGRIDADLRVLALPDRILLDLDVHAADRTRAGLDAFIIADDVSVADLTDATARFALHGPTARTLLAEAADPASGSADVANLEPWRLTTLRLADAEIVVLRDDTAGEIGLELFVPAHAAVAAYRRLVEVGSDPGLTIDGSRPTTGHRVRLRPAGWLAYNIARIEAGTPLYNIDFGPESLPAESGILEQRVSFTKGCYLGQEIVARMHSRGKPKQKLVALLAELPPAPAARDRETGLPLQPVGGSPVFKKPADVPLDAWVPAESDRVGALTSATLAPMRGSAPICFAQVRTDHTEPGTQLVIAAEGYPLNVSVQPTLTFFSRATNA